MYRKLVLGAVSLLGLMTLVVSAQQPASYPRVRQDAPAPNPPTTAGFIQYAVPPQPVVPFVYPYQGGTRSKEEFDLARQSETLAKQFGKADAENKEKLKAKLTDVLAKQFDARQKHQETEIAALEAQVKQLKEVVQKRQDNRREIISRRLEQLVRDAEGLGW